MSVKSTNTEVLNTVIPVKRRLDRCNTSFSMQIAEYLKSVKPESQYSFLKYYQQLVAAFVRDVSLDSRGLLLYWTMGTGKSLGGAAIAFQCVEEGLDVILLLSKSLHSNFRGALRQFIRLRTESDSNYRIGTLPDADQEAYIDRHFTMVSMNAGNMMKQVLNAAERDLDAKLERIVTQGTLRGKVIIVDEAQNLFRAITNGSKNAIQFYDLVMATPDCKIFFLSGTPAVSHPFEFVPCFNMLGGIGGRRVFPENFTDFVKFFIKDGAITARAKFQNRIAGLVSYISHTLPIAKGTVASFPDELPVQVERLPMDSDQFVVYQLARDKEEEEGRRSGKRGEGPPTPLMQKPKSDHTSSYRQRSRQISNYCPPAALRDKRFSEIDVYEIPAKQVDSPKFRRVLQNIGKHGGKPGFVYSQFTGAGGLGSLQRYLELAGWKIHPSQAAMSRELAATETLNVTENPVETVITDDTAQGGRESAVCGVYVPPQPTLDFIDRITREINSHLDATGTLVQGGSAPRNTFAVISGAVKPELRAELQSIFNGKNNRSGDQIRLLLISSSGAEGLDLKGVRHEHILEPYWTDARHQQVKHRGIRNASHEDLPESERNVQLYIYLATAPPDAKQLPTTDEELYRDAVANYELIGGFLSAIQESAIECQLSGGGKCRVCAPTNARLFHDDLDIDMRMGDPCGEVHAYEVQAKRITVDGTELYYKKSDNVYGYAIYEFDESLNGYREMRQDDPRFIVIIDAIGNAK